jgi:hypothetical protein
VRGSHTLWKAQVLVVLRGVQLVGFIEGTNPAPPEKIKVKAQKGEDLEEVTNPAFELWKAQEQQVLSYLLTSVSCDVLVQIVAYQVSLLSGSILKKPLRRNLVLGQSIPAWRWSQLRRGP